MRMRLGILHDADAQQRMHDREQRAAEERKRKAEIPTVRTEVEQKKHDEEQARAEHEGHAKQDTKKTPRVKIRPLSEAKAIELGANFFSEAFIFAVAAGLLVWDSWRSRKKASQRRDDVAERLSELEAEVGRLRSRYEPQLDDNLGLKGKKAEKGYSWYNPAGWFARNEPVGAAVAGIPGSVPVAEPEKAIKPTPENIKETAASDKDGKIPKIDIPQRVDTAAAAEEKER